MRKIDEAELNKILSNHKLWLMDESNGIRADLSGVDLEYADLDGADLRDANLRSANLRSANLWYANLRGADLRDASLGCADLGYADLGGANLYGADLRGADLGGANLWSTDLSCVKNIFFPMACPEKGSFIAFKKAGCYIIELFIPSNAKRCSATSRKCRCSKAKVISITTPSGDKTNITEVYSNEAVNY